MLTENRPAFIASILLICFLSISIWLVRQYISTEEQRDIDVWSDRLSVIADSQQRAIETWLSGQAGNMKELADNRLLQFYLTLKKHGTGIESDVVRGQEGHLRNLLDATAGRSGVFAGQNAGAATKANLNEGLAILDSNAGVIMATPHFPEHYEEVKKAYSAAIKGGTMMTYGIYANARDEPRMIFILPLQAEQAAPGAKEYTGAVAAVINPANSLYKILAQNWLTTSTDETLLVVLSGEQLVYKSPLSGQFDIFYKQPVGQDSISGHVQEKNNSFSRTRDYRGVDVFVVSRQITNTPWTMIQKIDVEEALRESAAHQEFILTVFLLAVFIVTISFIAIWRHATSIRLQKLSDRLAARTLLLNSVSDSIRDHIFLLDSNSRIIFINEALLSCLQAEQRDVLNKGLADILEPETAKVLLQLKQGDNGDDIRNRLMKLSVAGIDYVYHVSVVCLKHGEYRNSTLYVLHDVTYTSQVQERHNRLMEGIIATLVRVTDMHDPHCAHHSERTREVAVTIAEAMGLDKNRTDMLSMAALLANIGKLYLPGEMLTKMEPLTDEEAQKLKNNVLDTVAILRGLDFEGPVITFIEQKNEHLDGSGYPAGLKGEEILLESRILSVANAFVALSSARAYRPGKPVEDVISILFEQADSQFDRKIVQILAQVAENNPEWRNWQTVV